MPVAAALFPMAPFPPVRRCARFTSMRAAKSSSLDMAVRSCDAAARSGPSNKDRRAAPITSNLYGLAGSGSELYAVGEAGVVGKTQRRQVAARRQNTGGHFVSLFRDDDHRGGDVYAIGDLGTVLRKPMGGTWTKEPVSAGLTTAEFRGVAETQNDELTAVGLGGCHRPAQRLRVEQRRTCHRQRRPRQLLRVAKTSEAVFIAGDSNRVLRRDADKWRREPTGNPHRPKCKPLRAFCQRPRPGRRWGRQAYRTPQCPKQDLVHRDSGTTVMLSALSNVSPLRAVGAQGTMVVQSDPSRHCHRRSRQPENRPWRVNWPVVWVFPSIPARSIAALPCLRSKTASRGPTVQNSVRWPKRCPSALVAAVKTARCFSGNRSLRPRFAALKSRSVHRKYRPIRKSGRCWGSSASLRAAVPCVVEGRDIGTVVLPDAPLKIFLTASPESPGATTTKKNWKRGGQSICRSDPSRTKSATAAISPWTTAPLKCADDAVLFDTSEHSLEQVLDALVSVAHERLKL